MAREFEFGFDEDGWDLFLSLVRGELQAARGSWRAIGKATGLGYRWINTFANVERSEVTIRPVLILAAYLGVKATLRATAE